MTALDHSALSVPPEQTEALVRLLTCASLVDAFAHQAKNDLFAMTGLADLALGQGPLPAESQTFIETLRDNGDSLQQAARQLLDFSRATASEESSVSPVGEAAREAVALAESLSLLRHVNLSHTIGQRTPVRLRRTALVTLIISALAAAITRAEHASAVTLSVERVEPDARVEIAWQPKATIAPSFDVQAATLMAVQHDGSLSFDEAAGVLTLLLPLAV